MRRSFLIGGLALSITLVLDQVSKWLVLETLGPNGPRDVIHVIPGVLNFDFVRNTGSAFGLFQGNSDILKVLAIVAVVGLFIYYVRTASRDWVVSLALGLQLGGALGNIADRFLHGYVVDFIDVRRFPTFNVADSAITVGVVLLLFALLFRDDVSQAARTAPQRSDQRHAVGDDV